MEFMTYGGSHKIRSAARKDERKIQSLLDRAHNGDAVAQQHLHNLGIPSDAKGAAVRKVGAFEHIVVLTENVGH